MNNDSCCVTAVICGLIFVFQSPAQTKSLTNRKTAMNLSIRVKALILPYT